MADLTIGNIKSAYKDLKSPTFMRGMTNGYQEAARKLENLLEPSYDEEGKRIAPSITNLKQVKEYLEGMQKQEFGPMTGEIAACSPDTLKELKGLFGVKTK